MVIESNRPIAIDLFAGAGGLSLGLEQAGFDVAACVELDPIHAAVHKYNFPDSAVLCRDVRELTGKDIRKAAGIGRRTLDLVAGGPPCQGFSLIGKRVLEDPRNSLVQHFMRLVLELRPRTFLMENVPGMASGEHTHLLDELIRGFEAGGYKVRKPYQLLNATYFGVPQNRTRLFLVGARSDVRVPAYPTPITRPPSGTRLTHRLAVSESLRRCPSVEDALADLPHIDASGSERTQLPTADGSAYARRLGGRRADKGDFSYPRVTSVEGLSGCRVARHTDRSKTRFASTEPGTTESVSRFFRLAPDGVCNTLRAGTATDRGAHTAARPIHYKYPRCISVREAARLHSYPDWFSFHPTIWHGFRQIGNSVPPLLARAVASEFITALGHEPSRPRTRVRIGDDTLRSFSMKDAAGHFGVSRHVIPPRRRSTKSSV